MSQIIIVVSEWTDKYPRLSGPNPVYWTTCTGRKLERQEILQRQLATSEELHLASPSRTVRFAGASWTRDGGEIAEWFEVEPGDQLTFVIEDFPDDETEDGRYTFTIPEGELPNPPVSLERDRDRLNAGLHKYYLQHAERAEP